MCLLLPELKVRGPIPLDGHSIELVIENHLGNIYLEEIRLSMADETTITPVTTTIIAAAARIALQDRIRVPNKERSLSGAVNQTQEYLLSTSQLPL